MSCDDFVEYMKFSCGLEVRLTWDALRPPGVSLLNRTFERIDLEHEEMCMYCKESYVRPDAT